MPIPSDSFPTEFYSKFRELYQLYDSVKKIVLLAEYENKEQKYIITSVNELRNMLDHVMRIIPENSTFTTNFNKAEGHLYRAGYDAYEIIAISKLQEIKRIKEQFSYEAITIGYPDYHKKIIPVVEKSKRLLVDARGYKKIHITVNDSLSEKNRFDAFENIVQELIITVDELNIYIPGIVEAQRNLRKKRILLYFLIPFTIAILSGLVLLLSEYNFFVKSDSVKNQNVEEVLPTSNSNNISIP